MLAVLARRDSHCALEGAMHRLEGAEAAISSDVRQSTSGGFKQPPARFHADGLDVGSGGAAEFLGEAAREGPHSHGGASGHDRNRKVASEMVGDPGCKLHEGVPFRTLSCELSTEL